MSTLLDCNESWAKLATSKEGIKQVIIHVHRNPSTGEWTMMKHLAYEQNKRSGVLSILGIAADQDWCSGTYRDELQQLNVPYILAGVPKLFGTGAFLLFIISNPVRKWMRQIRKAFPDAELVVHSHSAWRTGGFLPLPTKGRTAIIATFHGIADDHRLRNVWWLRKAHRFLAQRLYRSSAVLTSVSKETTVRAEEIFGIPHNEFFVVFNGIPALDISKTKAESKKTELLVGHVGQMHHGKGWRLLLEAVDRLRGEGKNIQLVLAGEGQDTELAQAQALKRKEYVRFLGIFPNAAERLIPQLDVLVLATWSEGMPMTVIEAFAAGVSVVATPVGGIPEMVEDNVNGLIIERNVDAIVEALKRFLSDSQLSSRLGSNALKTFQSTFEISRVASEYAKVYDAALNRNNKSALKQSEDN